MNLLRIGVGLMALCMFVGNSLAKKGDLTGSGDVIAGKVCAAADKDGNIKIKKQDSPDAAPAAPDEVTIATDASTVVKIDKVAAKVSAIQVGMFIRVSPATGTAKTINVITRKPGGKSKKPK